ncbi:hypothetical protein ABZM97_03060 [Bacillus vallismortis]
MSWLTNVVVLLKKLNIKRKIAAAIHRKKQVNQVVARANHPQRIIQ